MRTAEVRDPRPRAACGPSEGDALKHLVTTGDKSAGALLQKHAAIVEVAQPLGGTAWAHLDTYMFDPFGQWNGLLDALGLDLRNKFSLTQLAHVSIRPVVDQMPTMDNVDN